MINKKGLSLNIIFSLLQIFITGLSYYFLYKYLLQQIGTDLMGVWAIVLSVSSSANIANFGIGTGVVRFTAKFNVNNELKKINNLLQTSLIFISVIFGILCSIIFILAPIWLQSVISGAYYADAIKIIPYSLVCLFLNALSGIFLSCIDGFQKNFIRSLLYIGSIVFLLFGSYLFVPSYGLMGVAYSQLAQSVFLFLYAWISLKLVYNPLRIFPLKWDKQIFKNIFSFGIQEQVISICQLCFDPFTKSVLGSFGNLTMVTYYEMASRLITQLRGFLVSANQVLIPIFTSTSETSVEGTYQLYKRVFSINFLLSLLWLAIIIASVIPISKIWIGNVNNDFVVITIVLALGNWCNILMSPPYFANMGSGTIAANVKGNVIIAILNFLLSFILGYTFNSYGVVAAWSISLAAGSIYIIYNYHKHNKVYCSDIVTRPDYIILMLCMIYSTINFSLFICVNQMNVWKMFAIDAFLFSLMLYFAFVLHPLRRIILLENKGML